MALKGTKIDGKRLTWKYVKGMLLEFAISVALGILDIVFVGNKLDASYNNQKGIDFVLDMPKGRLEAKNWENWFLSLKDANRLILNRLPNILVISVLKTTFEIKRILKKRLKVIQIGFDIKDLPTLKEGINVLVHKLYYLKFKYSHSIKLLSKPLSNPLCISSNQLLNYCSIVCHYLDSLLNRNMVKVSEAVLGTNLSYNCFDLSRLHL